MRYTGCGNYQKQGEDKMNDADWDKVIDMIKEDILKRIDKDLDKEASREEIQVWCRKWTVPRGREGDKGTLIAAIATFISVFPDR